MSEMNRREFVAASAAAVGLCVLGCEFAQGAATAATVDIGTPADFPADGVADKFAKSDKLLIVRKGDRIYVLNAACTHKGTTVRLKDGQIKCPSHGSVFSDDGTRATGPAKAALFRFGISQNDQGRLIVDKSQQFGQQQWDDPAAFVNLKAT